MHSYVYQTTMEYQSSAQLLAKVRSQVSHLKKANPELESCSLADVSLQKGSDAVNVTLYFKENSHAQGS